MRCCMFLSMDFLRRMASQVSVDKCGLDGVAVSCGSSFFAEVIVLRMKLLMKWEC